MARGRGRRDAPAAGRRGPRAARRAADGAPLPQMSATDPAVHYEYIDDYGIVGLERDRPEPPGAPRQHIRR